MRPHLSRTALLAAALLGGMIVTPTAAAQAPGRAALPDCTVRSADIDVAVDAATRSATTTATWDVSCLTPANVTAELRIESPHRLQRPVKSSFGSRFTGRTWTSGTVDPINPAQTAVLTLSADGTIIGQIRECAKKADGTDSCYDGTPLPTPSTPTAKEILHRFFG
ncbi:hypothetical protein ABZW18_23845 [Streptomyces sp. NPDC004647]|uniref:hypothetical protein n=1 Tax=Streptomyces sp. NPDC004647 TaxID=3154671 RepID=UPI00339FA8FE